MSAIGKRKFRSVVEEGISQKMKEKNIAAITADTFRSDSAAILESLLAELDEDAVVEAMNHQGFEGKAYRWTIKKLAEVAKERRPLRKAGSGNKGSDA